MPLTQTTTNDNAIFCKMLVTMSIRYLSEFSELFNWVSVCCLSPNERFFSYIWWDDGEFRFVRDQSV